LRGDERLVYLPTQEDDIKMILPGGLLEALEATLQSQAAYPESRGKGNFLSFHGRQRPQ
jgi:hypothetical protein